MSSQAGSKLLEELKLPVPPYYLLPLLPSPIVAEKAPTLPTPYASGAPGWQCSTHLFPAAFPRSHALSTSPPVPAPSVVPDERAQRTLDFAAWDAGCARWSEAEFLPQTSQAAALEEAKRLAAQKEEKPLWGVVQRWTNPSAAARKDGIVIVAGHANGFHKECYEPTFSRLLATSSVPIAEIWSMDTIDSGYAGVVNEGKLGWTVAWQDHARDFLSLLAHIVAPGEQASDVLASPASLDYDSAAPPAGGRKVLAIGHSYSGAGLLWTAYTRPKAIDSIFLVDPVLPSLDFIKNLSRTESAASMPLGKGAVARKDVFESREAAKANLGSKPFFQVWDARTLDLYLKYGFRSLSSDGSTEAVTLAMSKWREAAAFANTWSGGFAREAALQRKHASRIHAIRMDGSFVTAPTAEAYKAIGADLQVLKGGHLVVQEQPDMLADYTAKLLERWYAPASNAKL